MTLSLAVLGSGSGGNCSVVRLDGADPPRLLMIDAGLSMRQTRRRMARLGVEPGQITDLLLTHLDHDHLGHAWRQAVRNLGVTVHLHRQHLRAALDRGLTVDRISPFEDDFDLGDDARIEVVRLAHDELGTTGFVIEHGGGRLGWATDLGRVPKALRQRFVNLNALAIESNYDRAMQVASRRPPFLKRRIMGGRGHLENEQALEAVLHVAGTSRLVHLVLLHLSRQCNDPSLVRALWADRAPDMVDRLVLSHQHEPTAWLTVPGGVRPPATLFDDAVTTGTTRPAPATRGE